VLLLGDGVGDDDVPVPAAKSHIFMIMMMISKKKSGGKGI
jgi:hypothetical protein